MNALQIISQLRSNFNALPKGRRMIIIASAMGTLLLLLLFVYMVNRVEYQVLFSGLSSEDAASVVAKLQEKKIPYRVSSSGDTIYAPSSRVPELRIELASSGVLRGGTVGFELFDNKSFGATEFEQQVNYRRALQGELSRTINSIEGVQQSRVHIAIPKESLFVEQQKRPSASVTLKLKPGRTIRPDQIDGIVNLVAKSVEGMTPEDVIVIDSRGNILSRNPADSRFSRLSATQVEYQKNLEKEIAHQIQSLLEKVVGRGKAIVRVAADLDFRVTEKTEEIFDPESAVVRSIQKQESKNTTGGTKSGAMGQEQQRMEETVNYEINRVSQKTVLPVGEIKKLSIAVVVDGTYVKDEKGRETFQERSKKELEVLEELVRKSAGFDANRGDQVVVSCLPLSKVEADSSTSGFDWYALLNPATSVVKYITLLAALVSVLFFGIRPLVRILTAKTELAPATFSQTPQKTLEGRETPLQITAEDLSGKTETEIIRQLASTDAKKFAEILRNWVR